MTESKNMQFLFLPNTPYIIPCGGEKVSIAPLYYPDTLVNPDTCLGAVISILLVRQKISLTTSLTYMVSCRYLMRPCVVDIPQKYIIRYLTRTLTICSEILGYTTDKEFG